LQRARGAQSRFAAHGLLRNSRQRAGRMVAAMLLDRVRSSSV
jgi:hypothetical protein